MHHQKALLAVLAMIALLQPAKISGAYLQKPKEPIFGVYRFLKESSDFSPKKGATIELEIIPPETITVAAAMPGEKPLTDVGTFSIQGNKITLRFPGLGKSKEAAPYEFDGATLTLPLLMIADGDGTSTWKKISSPSDPVFRAAGAYRLEILNGKTKEEALTVLANDLRSNPSVKSVAAGPSGRSFVVTFKRGYQEVFLSTGAARPKDVKKRKSAILPSLVQSASFSPSDESAAVIPVQAVPFGLQLPGRRIPTKEEKFDRWLQNEPEPVSRGDAPKIKNVLIIAPFQSTAIPVADSGASGPAIHYENLSEDLNAISGPLSAVGYTPAGPYEDTTVTVERLWRLLKESWGVVYFRGHGGCIDDGDYILATGQLIPEEYAKTDQDREWYLNQYLNKFLRDEAAKVRPHVIVGLIEGRVPVVAVKSGFFTAAGGDRTSSLVFINACESAMKETLVQAVCGRSFVGWRGDADRQLGSDVAAPFFRCLVKKTRTDREAADFAKNYLLEIKGYDSLARTGGGYDPNNLDVYRQGKSEPEKPLNGRHRRMMQTVRDWAIRKRLSEKGKEDLEHLTDRLLTCTKKDLSSVNKAMPFPTFCNEAFAFEIAPRDEILEVKFEICGSKGGGSRFTLLEK